MDRKQIASIQESIGETSSQSVVVAVDRYCRNPQLKKIHENIRFTVKQSKTQCVSLFFFLFLAEIQIYLV